MATDCKETMSNVHLIHSFPNERTSRQRRRAHPDTQQKHEKCLSTCNDDLHRHWDAVNVDLAHLFVSGVQLNISKVTGKRQGSQLHSRHVVAPVTLTYVSAPQSTHTVAAVAFPAPEYLPAPQSTQVGNILLHICNRWYTGVRGATATVDGKFGGSGGGCPSCKDPYPPRPL